MKEEKSFWDSYASGILTFKNFEMMISDVSLTGKLTHSSRIN